MNTFFLFLILWISAPAGYANSTCYSEVVKIDPVNIKLDKAQAYFNSGNENAALQIYLSVLKDDPSHYEALWNTSLLYTRKGRRQPTYEAQSQFYRIAREFAQLTMDKHPEKPRSHYVYGVSSLGLADDMPNSSERIQLIRDVKEHGDKALNMDPEYAPAWHLMGVWHSNMANIGRGQRLGARILYGSLPDGSNEKAELYLRKAVELDPAVIMFRLDLAQHYHENNQGKKAIPVLESILEMQIVSENDYIDMKEAKQRYDELR
jgi:tetratricopeptide (TPR) repeat protein